MRDSVLLNGALTTEEVMSGVPLDDLEEPTNRELLEYLGLEADEIEEALAGVEEIDMGKSGFKRYEDRYSKQTSFWSGGNSAAGTTTSNYKRCTALHDGGTYIYKRGGITIGGARGYDLDGKYPSLVIDLAGTYSSRVQDYLRRSQASENFIQFGPERFEVLKDHIIDKTTTLKIPEILRLDWADMKEPPVTLEFWRELWNLVPQDGHTLFCCVGGHGRTGTALAAMMIADNPAMSADEAIKTVRKLHCQNAIESLAQEDYLKSIADARGTTVLRKKVK